MQFSKICEAGLCHLIWAQDGEVAVFTCVREGPCFENYFNSPLVAAPDHLVNEIILPLLPA